jgi:hypothetical protein
MSSRSEVKVKSTQNKPQTYSQMHVQSLIERDMSSTKEAGEQTDLTC